MIFHRLRSYVLVVQIVRCLHYKIDYTVRSKIHLWVIHYIYREAPLLHFVRRDFKHVSVRKRRANGRWVFTSGQKWYVKDLPGEPSEREGTSAYTVFPKSKTAPNIEFSIFLSKYLFSFKRYKHGKTFYNKKKPTVQWNVRLKKKIMHI